MLYTLILFGTLITTGHAQDDEDGLTSPRFSRQPTKPVICTIEEVLQDGGYHNTSEDVLSAALDMASTHIGSDMFATFVLKRKYVTPENVLSGANGDFVQEESCAGLLVVAKCPVAAVISEMATNMRLFHVLFHPDVLACRIRSRYMVDLATSEERYIGELRNVFKDGFRWRRVLLLHDHLLKSRGIFMYKMALSKASAKFKVLPLEKITSEAELNILTPRLKQVFEAILFMKQPSLDLFIKFAAKNNLLLPHHQWLIMSDTTCWVALNKAILRNSSTVMLKPKYFIRSSDYLRCPGHTRRRDDDFHNLRAHLVSVGIYLLLNAASTNLSWSCLENSPGQNKYHNIFNDPEEIRDDTANNEPLILTTNEGQVTIDLDTRLVTSLGFEYCSSYSKKEQGYSYKHDWQHVMDNITKESVFENVFKDFGGATLVVATSPAPPYVIKTTKGNQPPKYTGFCFKLLDELAKRLKFKYKVVEPSDGQFGSLTKNSSWSGIVGMLLDKKATLGVGPVSITSERKSVIDFTTAFAEDGIGILTRRPGFGSSEMFRLFKPFESQLWLCLACSILVTSAVLYVINKMSPLSAGRCSRSSSKLKFFHTFWAILASSLQQGTSLDPTSHAARLVLGFWWVFIIIVVSTYTASLAAVLTVKVFKKAINSLSELAAQSEVTPLIKPGTNLQTLFQTATNAVYRTIASRLVVYPAQETITNEEAMLWVKEKNMAFMTDRSQLEYAMQQECETFALAHEMFNTGGLAFVLPKDAPFLNALNFIIIRLRQSGIIQGWREQWWTKDNPQCSTGVKMGEGQHLDLIYLAGPFFVFLFGLVVSGLIAVCDWAWRTGKLDPLTERLRWRTSLSINT